MLVESLHIGPCAPTLLRRCRPFGAKTHRVKTHGITWQDRFEANVTLPIGAVIIDIPEALTTTETKYAQPDVSGLHPVTPIVLAVEVECVQVFIAPVESDLQHRVEVRQGRITTNEQATPDEWTDLSQDDAELIDAERFNGLIHTQSVPRRTLRFKVSPRYLALSYHGEQRAGATQHPSAVPRITLIGNGLGWHFVSKKAEWRFCF